MGLELVLFLVVAALAVIFAVGMLLSENAVYSALFLIGNFGTVAFLFLMLDAPFISMVQIAVYAGAIMVLFLFVIMLLGAEKTTDTSRSFRWLTGTTLILMAILLGIGGGFLAFNSFELPDYVGDAPQLRVVHASLDVPDVNVELVGADGEPVLLEGLAFGDTSDRIALEPGEYTVNLRLADSNATVFSQAVTLEGGSSTTAVAYGEFGGGTFSLEFIEDNVDALQNGETRLVVLNTFSEDPVTLVDLGPRDMVLTRERPVLDENGEEVLDENGSPIMEDGVGNRVLANYTLFGEITEVVIESGDYNMAFVNDSLEEVYTIHDVELPDEVVHMVVLAAEPPEFETDEARPVALTPPNVSALSFGGPESVGIRLFTDYILPVQIVGMLLLVGLVGVVILSRPDGEKREPRQRRRRKVSRPLISVITQQTGHDILEGKPQLEQPSAGD